MDTQVGLLIAHYTQGINVDWICLVYVADAALFNTRHHHGMVRVLIGKQRGYYASIN
jgi:hypothetical protein